MNIIRIILSAILLGVAGWMVIRDAQTIKVHEATFKIKPTEPQSLEQWQQLDQFKTQLEEQLAQMGLPFETSLGRWTVKTTDLKLKRLNQFYSEWQQRVGTLQNAQQERYRLDVGQYNKQLNALEHEGAAISNEIRIIEEELQNLTSDLELGNKIEKAAESTTAKHSPAPASQQATKADASLAPPYPAQSPKANEYELALDFEELLTEQGFGSPNEAQIAPKPREMSLASDFEELLSKQGFGTSHDDQPESNSEGELSDLFEDILDKQGPSQKSSTANSKLNTSDQELSDWAEQLLLEQMSSIYPLPQYTQEQASEQEPPPYISTITASLSKLQSGIEDTKYLLEKTQEESKQHSSKLHDHSLAAATNLTLETQQQQQAYQKEFVIQIKELKTYTIHQFKKQTEEQIFQRQHQIRSLNNRLSQIQLAKKHLSAPQTTSPFLELALTSEEIHPEAHQYHQSLKFAFLGLCACFLLNLAWEITLYRQPL